VLPQPSIALAENRASGAGDKPSVAAWSARCQSPSPRPRPDRAAVRARAVERFDVDRMLEGCLCVFEEVTGA
jgi:hypothetical protein